MRLDSTFLPRLFRSSTYDPMHSLDSWTVPPPMRSDVSFKDIGGHAAAKQLLSDVLACFVGNIGKKPRLKCHVPKGILLQGPFGVGKIHLARAIAGEGNLALFHVSCHELMDSRFNVGASRVHRLFDAARINGPSLVLMDEIDVIGCLPAGLPGGSESKRELTLYGLLAELDDFSRPPNVLVVAVTSRSEILDLRLLRSGRFDLILPMHYPDLADREEVIRVLLSRYKCSAAIGPDKIMKLAQQTACASQSDLNLIFRLANRSALARGAEWMEACDLDKVMIDWTKSTSAGSSGYDSGGDLPTSLSDLVNGVTVSVTLISGESVEGRVRWWNKQYLKLLTSEQPQGILLSWPSVANCTLGDSYHRPLAASHMIA